MYAVVKCYDGFEGMSPHSRAQGSRGLALRSLLSFLKTAGAGVGRQESRCSDAKTDLLATSHTLS